MTGKFAETRNLLAEKDMYHVFEFTSLRQQVFIIREVTREAPVFSYLAAFCPSLSRRAVAEKFASGLLERELSKFLWTP
jgi:hypothetical protein